MGLRIFPLLLFTCLLSGCVSAQDKIKGIGWGTGHDLWGIRQPFAKQSLKILKTTGVNYVHISAYVKMTHKDAWWYRRETDDESIRYQIRMMKDADLKVFFKPVIEIDNHVWRGFIPGRPAWLFKVYVPFIVHMAKIAQEEGVELFSIGSEYRETLKGKKNEIAWRYIIKRVRQGNHDSYKKVKFWDALDMISLSAYFVLQDGGTGKRYGASPSLALTKELWGHRAAEIAKWRLRRGHWDKKILIAEVGFQSKGRGVVYRVPFDWVVPAPVNNWEQTKMYEGLLGAFMPEPWCAGVVLWNWELHPYANNWEPFKSGYTPQNKPAMKVMQKYFFKKY